MLHEEARAEADRRNREDPDRERFEFYPFDESAGMAEDAWDVAARLRQGPSTARPATAAAAARAPEPAAEPEVEAPGGREAGPGVEPGYETAHERAAEPEHETAHERAAEPEHETAYEPAAEPEYETAYEPAAEPGYETAYEQGYEPAYEPAPAGAAHARDAYPAEPLAEWDEGEPDVDRPGFFVRLVGAVVILVGLAWLGVVVALALVLGPDDATSFAIYLGAAALGVLAMALGVAIRRS